MTRVEAIAIVISLAGYANANDEIGVYFDAAASTSSVAVAPGGQIDAWVILTNLSSSQSGVEYGLYWSAGLSLVSSELLIPNSLNLGTATNVIMGFGVCLTGPTRPIYRYTFQLPTSGDLTDLYLQVYNAQPCSFGDRDCMNYTSCATELVTLSYAQNGNGHYGNGSAIINPTREPPVGQLLESFGLIKALYR